MMNRNKEAAQRVRSPRRCNKGCGLAGIRTVSKMRGILVLSLIACPLALLIAMEGQAHTGMINILAGWIALGFILLMPLSHWLSELLVLRQVRELNGLCEQMKSGNLTPFAELPAEPEGGDPLQSLRCNMFWIGHIIDSRQRALNGAMRNLHTAQEQLVESIEYAGLIQNAFLPSEQTLHELFADHFLIWDQRDAVGGDAYWVKRTQNGFFLAVVDCTGHGVPGAFMTLIVHSLFERLEVNALEGNPAGVVSAMNRSIRQSLAQDRDNPLSDDGMDCAVVYVDTAGGMLHFAGARSSLFVRSAQGDVLEIKGCRCGAGYVRTPEDYEFMNHSLRMEPDSRFYCLTDGLTDQVGGVKHLPFGKSRFKHFISACGALPFVRQKALLEAQFKEYMGREARRDDVTVLGFMVNAR
ncbi:SpoIIE family protein phosphatase [Desulfovibrio mangrovi]|uniref:SpoIIE family protein phosphatase n=1 Tax=Desulfovibrio mangrovi TaxID=2976983 RepID=UPI002247EBDC|nr:SpoIIE family protein phosphatase [Desulfovibrio mangrovi]UZP66421.1 SpoIIE family protein phosphatase [Desulfovibrio mangrovi]